MKIRKIVSLLVSLFLLVNPVFGALAKTDEAPAAETEEKLALAEGAVQEGKTQQTEAIKVPEENIPEEVPEENPEETPEEIHEEIPEENQEENLEEISEENPEEIPEENPEEAPETMPEETPEEDSAGEAPEGENTEEAPETPEEVLCVETEGEILNAASAPEAETPALQAEAPAEEAEAPALQAEAPAEEANQVLEAAAPAEETPALETTADSNYQVTYDYNAGLYDPASGNYIGVYSTQLNPNENAGATVGMPSIADANLDTPTTEAPAIIQGAATGYENRLGPVNYEVIKERVDPYTDYKVTIMDEQGQDGTVHQKPTGFDGTYVVTRLDVGELFDGDVLVFFFTDGTLAKPGISNQGVSEYDFTMKDGYPVKFSLDAAFVNRVRDTMSEMAVKAAR